MIMTGHELISGWKSQAEILFVKRIACQYHHPRVNCGKRLTTLYKHVQEIHTLINPSIKNSRQKRSKKLPVKLKIN